MTNKARKYKNLLGSNLDIILDEGAVANIMIIIKASWGPKRGL
jgi:hypothetical protein